MDIYEDDVNVKDHLPPYFTEDDIDDLVPPSLNEDEYEKPLEDVAYLEQLVVDRQLEMKAEEKGLKK